MPESEFYTPTDMDALRMENELLAFEVRFLRSRLGKSKTGRGTSLSLSRLSYLEEAERDLVLLLRRMASSPVSPILRRSASFRTLEGRYLQAPVEGSSSSPERVTYLEGAERDLVLLLRRMSSSPLGRVFRRSASFRTLEGRYL